jgi:hypothetical protein
MEPVTHEQIYQRLISLETKVDSIDHNTKDIVQAFNSVQGAFKVLGWVANIAKPILWIAGVVTAFSVVFQAWKK